MPESSVFPGGVCDATDSSPAWLEHFHRSEIAASKLRDLGQVKGPRPHIFQAEETDKKIDP